MKKIYYLMLAMLMAMTTLGLTACGDDDEDGPNGGGGDIVGTWKCNMLDYKDEIEDYDEISEYTKSFDSYFKFEKDGHFTSVTVLYYTQQAVDRMKDYPGFENPVVDVDKGTYTVSGNKLAVNYFGDDEDDNEVNFSVKGKTLTFSYIDEFDGKQRTIKFTKVNDNELDKYLKDTLK